MAACRTAQQDRAGRPSGATEEKKTRKSAAAASEVVPAGQGDVPWHGISDFRITDSLVARVNYSTGNLMLAATDFDISGVGRRLQLTRTYNSLDARRLAEQTDPAELAERRRRSDAARARRHRVELLRAIFRAVDARDPLRPEAARGLLIELADAEQHSMATLGTSAGLPARWHPDVEGGDGEIFQLLETAYRTVKLLP